MRDKILRVAAHLLGVDAAELERTDAAVRVRGAPGHGMRLREVARASRGWARAARWVPSPPSATP